MALMSFLVRGVIRRSRALGAETTRRNNETYSVVGERITAIRLIKMLGQEKAETRKVTRVVKQLADAQVRIAIFSGVIEVTLDPLNMLMPVRHHLRRRPVLQRLARHARRLSRLAAAVEPARQELQQRLADAGLAIDSLISVHQVISKATASLHIVGGDTPFEGVHENISFENVSFAYGDEKEHLVLKGVDLVIPSRSQTAIVGRSGGGKSTLVDLIPRLREATSGEILFDGKRIQEFELRSLRRSIGFMTQDALRSTTRSTPTSSTASTASRPPSRSTPRSRPAIARPSSPSFRTVSRHGSAIAACGCRAASASVSRWPACSCRTPTS